MSSVEEKSSARLRRKTVVTVISKIGDRRAKADACLVVIYGSSLGRMYRLKGGETLIGRSSQADIQIDHESVSRRHAVINLQEKSATVRDLGSTNGSYINDVPIEERELIDGDLVKIGRTILKYLSSDNIESAYHDEIYRLTTVDGLTKAFNRRYLREQLIRETSRAVRYKRPLSVVTLDIDGFKSLNEDFGHLAGDSVLAQLGKRVGRRIRREDTFARYEGGQFAIILPENDKATATELAERILAITNEGVYGFEDIEIPLSVTMGVASLSEIDVESPVRAGVFEDTTSETDRSVSSGSKLLGPETTDHDEGRDRFLSIGEQVYALSAERLQKAKSQKRGSVGSH